MKKILMMLALSLPLIAQEVEVKETADKTEVTVKKQHDKKKWNRGDMKSRGSMKSRGMDKRMMMAKRREMRKKRFWRSAVRVVVIGGVAYYVGYQQGMKKDRKKGGMKRPIWMGDREKK
mgnify:CR=1 FL=1|tara:strand:- start:10 stop:366 length:357 start_codon:yes stop_codon:yes gene_type:complete